MFFKGAFSSAFIRTFGHNLFQGHIQQETSHLALHVQLGSTVHRPLMGLLIHALQAPIPFLVAVLAVRAQRVGHVLLWMGLQTHHVLQATMPLVMPQAVPCVLQAQHAP